MLETELKIVLVMAWLRLFRTCPLSIVIIMARHALDNCSPSINPFLYLAWNKLAVCLCSATFYCLPYVKISQIIRKMSPIKRKWRQSEKGVKPDNGSLIGSCDREKGNDHREKIFGPRIHFFIVFFILLQAFFCQGQFFL